MAALSSQSRSPVKLFDSKRRRAIEDFRAYAAERAIAFNDLEATDENENTRRLSILDSLVAGKRFAYVGESDHFIHEKYAYRLAILNYLAARGFTHVGEEIGASDGMRIDRYIEPATNRSSSESPSTVIRAHPAAIATTLRLASSAAASETSTRPRNSPPSRSDSRMACAKSVSGSKQRTADRVCTSSAST
jgi:erythromycin esterase-like protein